MFPDIAAARKAAGDVAASPSKRIGAIDFLLKSGAIADAERYLDELNLPPAAEPMLRRLREAARQLSSIGVPAWLAANPSLVDALSRAGEVFVAEPDRYTRTILVWTGFKGQFWMSLPILHFFLEPFRARVIYLRDNSDMMFLGGLRAYGRDYAAMIDGLSRRIGPDRSELHSIAFSAGGFIGLRAVAELGAASYLGLSIRTDFSVGSPLPLETRIRQPTIRTKFADRLIDLRPWLALRDSPRRVKLLCAADNAIDRAHAQHIAGLDRVSVELVDSTTHNVVQHLVAEGRFSAVLAAALR